MNVAIIDASQINVAQSGSVNSSPIAAPPLFKALVDTGAQKTMISDHVANTLKLPVVGKIPVRGVGPGTTFHNGYLFNVAFVFAHAPPSAPPVTGTNIPGVMFIGGNTIYGGEITGVSPVFDVLLGMDVLSSGSLKVEGSGHFSFSI